MMFLNRTKMTALREATAGNAKAIAILDEIEDGIAPEGLRAEAAALYATDNIEIDDQDVATSMADDGDWVAAWVWVPHGD